MEPESASLTWIGLFSSEGLVFARDEVEAKKKKIDIRVEVTAKERWRFIRAFNSWVNLLLAFEIN